MSSGAHAFAESHSLTLVPPESLVSPRAQSEWRAWKERLDRATVASSALQDTVGAVCLDFQGRVAAGVSRSGSLCPFQI